jgi:long-chain acyl-CoA synthetase
MSNGRTLIQLFEESVQKYSDHPLLWEKQIGAYEPTTYKQAHAEVTKMAAGLMSLGIEPGDRVVLLSEGRNDWVYSELAILFCGAIDVPLSVKLKETNELKFRFNHSGARFAFVSGGQLGKITELIKDLASLEKIIALDSPEMPDHDILTVEELRKMGEEYLKSKRANLEDRKKSVRGDTPANICYTSGTTADPKGIVLTHRNYTANVEQASGLYKIPEEYVSLLILPWDHSFAHTAGIYFLMLNGASMASVELGKTLMETTRNIAKNIKEIKPHFLLSVPALSANFRKNIERGIEEKGLTGLFNKALKTAYAFQGDGFRNGKWHGHRLLKPIHAFFDKLIFQKIRNEGFGGRLKFFVGGGALLDIAFQKFFTALGIPIHQGYGLSEAAPIISANCPGAQKMGTSGRVVPNLKIKICDDTGRELPKGQKGEIVVRGENVMVGYWNNPEASAKTVKDGWLFTGDMGYMDDEDFLVVLGRYKSLLISDDGEKFSPEGIEEILVGRSKYIHQIMLYNNQNPYTTALIVPDKNATLEFLEKSELSQKYENGQSAVIQLIQDQINQLRDDPLVKAEFPSKWFPASFALLGEPFSEDNGFINSTMKMVRWKITDFYKSRLDYLYTPEGKIVLNHQNMTIISRFFN